MFEVGDVIGSYTVLAHLRSGGMADLYLARRDGAAGFRRLVAVKVVHPRHAESEHVVRMFLDEALITARIDHPNVVHVEDLGKFRNTYFLVMEYVHGCSLAQLMSALSRNRRRLSPVVAVAIAARVAEGLHAAHETTDDRGQLVRLVHRDVSPQNILLSHKGHVKLIDFGVAKAKTRSEETHVAMLKGKVRYMPPEQATTGVVDRRSDVYSLGIVLWEMLTMRRLFAGKTEREILPRVRDPKVEPPSEYMPDIAPELDRVVLTALQPTREDRPKDAKTFRRMLARAEPRSMALDSAHLADLMLSVVGDELDEIRHDLPQEVSRLLEAEQLRVARSEKQARATDSNPVSDAVSVMTLQSDMVSFEEDELDRTPEVEQPIPFKGTGTGLEASTRPGTPRLLERAELRQATSALSAAELDAAPTEEEAEPTMVGDVAIPGAVSDPPGSPLAAPFAGPTALPAATAPPVVPSNGGRQVAPAPARRRGLISEWLPWLAAAFGSVLFGVLVALLFQYLAAEDPPPTPVNQAPASAVSPDPDPGAVAAAASSRTDAGSAAARGGAAAEAGDEAGEDADEEGQEIAEAADAGVDAGLTRAQRRRRAIRRRRWLRRQRELRRARRQRRRRH